MPDNKRNRRKLGFNTPAAKRRNVKARHGSAGKAFPERIQSRKGRHSGYDTDSGGTTQVDELLTKGNKLALNANL
jgi:hypothetical protein